MPSEIFNKLNQLSPGLKAKLSQEDFLARVDKLADRYGIKAVIILLDLLLGELDYSDLDNFLAREYGFNQFLAGRIKGEFASLIETLSGETEPAAAPAKSRPEIKAVAAELLKRPIGTDSGKTHAPVAAIAADNLIRQTLAADAGLVFSAADEAEINKFGAASSAKTVPNYTLDAENILKNFTAKPVDPDLLRRLTNVVVSRIRGLRDDLEMREILMKETATGGVGLSAAEADELIKLIKSGGKPISKNYPAIPAQKINRSSAADETVDMIARQPLQTETERSARQATQPAAESWVPDLDFGEAEETEEAENAKAPAAGEPAEFGIEMEDGLPVVKAPISAVQTALKPANQLAAEWKNVKIQSVQPMPAPTPAPFIAKKTIPASVLNAKSVGRPNLDDIKLQRRLVGPIEELAGLTLIEFRRLGPDPMAATAKIKSTIDRLGEESFDQKHQGIAAWQKSEVNKFYRLLGQTAMNDGISIEEVIKDRLVAAKPTLTLEEFNAVMELNRQLRY